jgi:hypothetical protein
MRPTLASLWIGIGAAALVVGLGWLLWPTEAATGAGPVPEQGRLETVPAPSAPAAESRAPGPITPRASDDRGTTTSEADSAADAVITGQVLDFDGTPAPNVTVLLFPMRDGAPRPEPRRQALTDDQGRFRIAGGRTSSSERMLVAFKPRRQPATLRLANDPREPVSLVLREGLSIEGTVSVDGVPVRRAVVADTGFCDVSSLAFEANHWWNGTAFEPRVAHAVCDESGHFVLEGLAEDTYRVNVEQLAQEGVIGLVCRAWVRAPASGVRLAAHSGRLSIKVLGKDRVLGSARVSVFDPTTGAQALCPPQETTVVRVAAGIEITVEAAHAGFEPATLTVPALDPGETRVITIPLTESQEPRLDLTLRGARAMGLEAVQVRFIPMVRPPLGEIGALHEIREALRATRLRDELFVVEHIPHPPGSYIVVIMADPPGCLVPIRQDVSLPASGVVAIVDDAVTGGRLEVSIADTAGTQLFAEYAVNDARGRKVADRRYEFRRNEDPRQKAFDLITESRVLAPGPYEIVVSCSGYRVGRRTVTIRPNETTKEEVRLEPEAK